MKRYTLALILLACSSVFESQASESKIFESKGLVGLSVESLSGNITISSVDATKSNVIFTKKKFSEKCKLSMERLDQKLVIKVEKLSGLFSTEECDVDFQINVPKKVNLDLVVGSGNITINGMNSDLTFKVGSGDLNAEGIFNKINGKSGSGKVLVKGLIGGGELKIGSGDVDLTFVNKTLIGGIDLKIGSGDATIQFLKGTKIKTAFKAGSGELSNDLGDHSETSFKVSMIVGSGNLKIKSY